MYLHVDLWELFLYNRNILASGLLPILYIFSSCFLLSNVVMILIMLFAIQKEAFSF